MKNKFYHPLLMSILMAAAAVHSLSYITKTGGNHLIFNNSVLSLILLCTFSFIIFKALKIINRRLAFHAFIPGWFLSLALILGTELYLVEGLYYAPRLLLQKFLNTTFFSFLLSAGIALFIYYLPDIREFLARQEDGHSFKYFTLPDKKYFFYTWLLILICWLPCFLAYFPGIFSYDTPWQLEQVFTGKYNTHHPLLHTLYLGLCLKAGALLGSLQIGVAIHSLTQMLMLSAVFAYTCLFIRRLGPPVLIQLLSLAYFALMPINPLWAVNATKDVLFSAALLLVFLFIIQLVRQPREFFSSLPLMLRLFFTVLLMCALRNNGFYMFLLFAPVMVWMLKGLRKQALWFCLMTVVAHLGISSLMAGLLHSDSGNMGEMLSVPLQQIARTVNHVEEDLSPEELEMIFAVIPKEDIYEYLSFISDPVKEHFNDAYFRQHLGEYFRLWLNLGLRYPWLYCDAFLCNTYPLWYPDVIWQFVGEESLSTYLLTKNIPADDVDITLEQTPLLPKVRHFYERIATYSEYEKIPAISMLFSIGFQFWILCLAITTFFYYRRYQLFLPLFLLLTLWISLLLSPVVLLRYAYALFISVPVTLSLLTCRYTSTPSGRMEY